MRKSIKISVLAILVGAITFVSSCDIADELGFTTDLPSSYIGAWVDGNDNEIIVKAGNITVAGEVAKYKTVVLITSNSVDVYAIAVNDGDDTSDYYLKQPGSTDELQVSTSAVSSTDYVTYTKVQ